MKPREAVDAWNKANDSGVIVDVRRDNGDVLRTTTRSGAFLAISGDAVVFVAGISGFYLLDRVTRVSFSDDRPEYERAGGDCCCEMCGNLYFKHPCDLNHPSNTGHPWLVSLCDGRLVKL